ncbi:hypothetical protein N0V94_005254 [Neodidymelliopsis sp. IMI 364377]|nr:hypothetical protein N0V94_005254 [Neodidymelliopsis sp. IMI 364377]
MHARGRSVSLITLLITLDGHSGWSLRTISSNGCVEWPLRKLSLPDEEQADELKAAFNLEERDALRKLLLPLRDARTELGNNSGVPTKDIVKSVKSAAKIGIDWMEAQAAIVVTTASAGQQNRFVMMR